MKKSLFLMIWVVLIFAFGLLGGCSDDDSKVTNGGGGSGSWSGPAYSAYLGSVTVDSSGCLVFPAALTVISFNDGIATATVRITVSGSLEANDGYMMIYAYGASTADPSGSYKSSFSMDGVIPGIGQNVLALWSSIGSKIASITASGGGFTAFTTSQPFTSWVSDFNPGATSADSWWPDAVTTVAPGDVTNNTMGTQGGSAAFVSGVSTRLCSYALSLP